MGFVKVNFPFNMNVSHCRECCFTFISNLQAIINPFTPAYIYR